MALLEFLSPSSSEQNSDVAFTESNPGDARKTLKHGGIFNIPDLWKGCNQLLCTRQVPMELDKENPTRGTHGHTRIELQLFVNAVLPPATEK